MKINYVGIDIDKNLKKQLNKVCKTILKELKQSGRLLEVNIVFVNKEEILEINTNKRHVNKVTDVLSFPNLDNIYNIRISKKLFKKDINPDDHKILLGDIVVCLDIANIQAEDFGHSINREVCYLVTHGMLHLLGYDHMEDNEKAIMRSLEEIILKKNKLARI